jgi:hypothetical protein
VALPYRVYLPDALLPGEGLAHDPVPSRRGPSAGPTCRGSSATVRRGSRASAAFPSS